MFTLQITYVSHIRWACCMSHHPIPVMSIKMCWLSSILSGEEGKTLKTNKGTKTRHMNGIQNSLNIYTKHKTLPVNPTPQLTLKPLQQAL
jgi:hypothetical protein